MLPFDSNIHFEYDVISVKLLLVTNLALQYVKNTIVFNFVLYSRNKDVFKRILYKRLDFDLKVAYKTGVTFTFLLKVLNVR